MVSYKPLFKLLVDKNMSKADLRRLAEISPNTMTKLRRGEEVSLAVLNRICAVLGVSYGDIIEYVPQENKD
jgi:DNA-binding Xre family transcriptional regulator